MEKEKVLIEIVDLQGRINELKKELNNKNEFNFLDWYNELYEKRKLDKNFTNFVAVTTDFESLNLNTDFEYYETRERAVIVETKRICEYIFRKEIEYLNDGWIPCWNDKKQKKYHFCWNNILKRIYLSYVTTEKLLPEWVYIKEDKIDEALRLIDKLKKQFGKNIVKFALIEEW